MATVGVVALIVLGTAMFYAGEALREKQRLESANQAEASQINAAASCLASKASLKGKEAMALAHWGPMGEPLGFGRTVPIEVKQRSESALAVLSDVCDQRGIFSSKAFMVLLRMYEVDPEFRSAADRASRARDEQEVAESRQREKKSKDEGSRRAAQDDWAVKK